MWIERDIGTAFKTAAQERPAILVAGARQSGKTTLCRNAFPDFNYVSLDLPRLAEEAEHSGEAFLERNLPPLIIDEVQYAPALFRYLKHAIDRSPAQRGQYVLTGSQKFSLMEKIGESLAGRVAVLNLHTLSLAEIERAAGERAEGSRLSTWMHTGGYPELYAENIGRERFYSDYVATYLERDVRQALHVRNLRDFNRFMRLAAARTGQLLSLTSLASDVGVTPMTIKSWLSVLEASQIVYLLEPYHENFSKRLVKTPKLYFLDAGLACFLAGFDTPAALESSSMLGAFFETLVLGQLVRRFANQGRQERIYFYRDHEGMEVDFLIPFGDQFQLFECKYSENPGPVKAFRQFKNLVGEKRIHSRSIITPARGSRKTAEGVWIEDCVDFESLGNHDG